MVHLFATTASDILKNTCVGSTDPNCANPSVNGLGPVFRAITDTLLYLVGGIAVIMMIVGGMRFVLSGGNPANAKSARETILYAIVGLALAIVAYAMVQFVFTRLVAG